MMRVWRVWPPDEEEFHHFIVQFMREPGKGGRGGVTKQPALTVGGLRASAAPAEEEMLPLTFMGREHKSLITVKLLGFTSPKMGLCDSLPCRLSMRTWEVLKSRRTEPARDVTSKQPEV